MTASIKRLPYPLSVSAYEKYVECPRLYKLQYVDGIKEAAEYSFFIFGRVIDNAINAIHEGKEFDLSALNELVTKSKDLRFLPADYDGELLSDEEKVTLLKDCQSVGYKGDNVDGLVSSLMDKPFDETSENQRKALALCCRASLESKAKLMIAAYKRDLFPLIEKVNGIQKKHNWTDADGNEFTGIIDLDCSLNGYGDTTVDVKTDSNPFFNYPEDAVRTSFQLAVYSKVDGKTKAAYFVMDKTIKKNRIKTCSVCGKTNSSTHKTCEKTVDGKRCDGEFIHSIRPEGAAKWVIDDVPAEEQKISQEALTGVANAIRCGAFPMNVNSCRKKYGQKTVLCPYFNYCRNGSLEGLKVRGKYGSK